MRVTHVLAIAAAASVIGIVARAEHFAATGRNVASGCTVTDGDTIRCGAERVRLNGIDAPEMPGHCRQGRDCAPGDPFASRDHLALYLNQPLVIVPLKTDRYGRTVAEVYRKETGEDLSCLQLAAGQAIYVERWDERHTTAAACKEFAI